MTVEGTSVAGTSHVAGPAALLFLSGLAALVYQILWVKQLSLVVGVDVHAVTTGVSAFFAGLAIGGALFGRRADSLSRPLALFAALEVGVAGLGVAATWILSHAAEPFAILEARSGPLAWLLPAALVGVPAAAMGGSVPVLVRAVARQTGRLGSSGGILYAANTAGAVAGTLLTAFVLIPRLGIFGASCAAAGVNVLAALGAAVLASRSGSQAAAAPQTEPRARLPGSRLALALYSLAGGIALGYEVVWSQVVVQWTSTRTAAFAIVLATYLVGLMLGSAWFARKADRLRDPWGAFGLLIAAAGLVALLEVALLGSWLPALQVWAATAAFQIAQSEAAAMSARFLVAAASIVLLPTVLLGAAFPAALRLCGNANEAGRDTGAVLALNSLGGIAGSLVTGFLLIPALGLERTLAILALAATAVGGIAVCCGTRVGPTTRWGMLACGLATVTAALAVPPDHLARLLAASRKGTLKFHAPSAGGTVAVLEQGTAARRIRRLYIQGVSNSGDSMTSLRYMRLQALLPLIIHNGEPRSALVIGLGTGITAGSLLPYEGLDRRVCAELMPEVLRAVPLFEGNNNVASARGVEIRLRDGRRELLRNSELYDVITLEPPPPSAAGVVNLYSRDFYEIASRRLQPQGILAQWLPLPTQSAADTRSLIRSFLDAFPHATLWTTEIHEMLLVGSLAPMELDVPRIRSRFQQPGVARALQDVGIASPEALLATFVCDRPGLARYAGEALPTTDDRPRIEYGPWVVPGEFERTLVGLLELQIEPPLKGAEVLAGNTTTTAAVQDSRRLLHTFYATALYAYEGDRQKWSETLRRVLDQDPQNPYYRWFAGEQTPGAPQ